MTEAEETAIKMVDELEAGNDPSAILDGKPCAFFKNYGRVDAIVFLDDNSHICVSIINQQINIALPDHAQTCELLSAFFKGSNHSRYDQKAHINRCTNPKKEHQ